MAAGADLYRVTLSRPMALAILGAALPAAILFSLRTNEVTWNGPAHCWLVGASVEALTTGVIGVGALESHATRSIAQKGTLCHLMRRT